MKIVSGAQTGVDRAALDLIAGESHLFGWVSDLRDVERGIAAFTDAP